jgi:Zn-dependent alcohol dehydrogenase
MTSVRTNTLTFEEKVLTGSNFGGARPRHDFPRLLGLYRAKRLKLDELITRRYPSTKRRRPLTTWPRAATRAA